MMPAVVVAAVEVGRRLTVAELHRMLMDRMCQAFGTVQRHDNLCCDSLWTYWNALQHYNTEWMCLSNMADRLDNAFRSDRTNDPTNRHLDKIGDLHNLPSITHKFI